ncbi:MAG: Asp23/Gls24 family envelope stress response protein [Caldilineales bacterium]|nr:Asp23/Gls24 family envelope stress response protein [Caldilineales bacterium]MCW5860602.1 Asp23/Gls24 family envelope stress response protein [Caldilineales bacterium]
MADEIAPPGRVTIAPQVLTTIVRQTALSTEGVLQLNSRLPHRSRAAGRRALAPGIEVIVDDGKMQASVHVVADPGANMMRLAESLQTEIARAIEHIVGLQVDGVDVYIDNVSFRRSEPDLR